MATNQNQLAAHGVPAARFWTFENAAWVKITLRAGQSLSWGKWARADEGFAAEGNTWSHQGDRVLLQWSRSGRDCDGFMSEAGELECALSELNAVDADTDMPARPDWQKVGPVRCRDSFAEAAGY
jgi:hypothetical protein